MRLRRTSPRSSSEQLAKLAQACVDTFARELEAIESREERQHRSEADAEGQELRARHLRPARLECDGMDVVAREPDREEADGDQHDAEDRVHGGEVRPPQARLEDRKSV